MSETGRSSLRWLLEEAQGDLVDCTHEDLADRELIIVDNPSAGGNVKMGRDKASQAVFAFRDLFCMLTMDPGEERNVPLSAVLGCGSGPDCDVEKLRYSKLFILTGVDRYGLLIRSLLLLSLFEHMAPLVQAGRVWIIRPPEYEVAFPRTSKQPRGRPSLFFRSGNTLFSSLEALADWGPSIHRRTTVGEMSPEIAWRCVLDPENRIQQKVLASDEAAVRLGSLF
ncbi:MAG: hypothetical protein RL885_21695 [Planctomycetota bacterium]